LPALDGDGLLMGEVRHATGNLLHRMRYWTSLLEGEALGGPAAEAVTELRSSLDGLQQLIARTMELLRPSSVRPVAIPADDIARAVAIRFGIDPDSAPPLAQPRSCIGPRHVLVDPALLDRALTILSEVFPTRLDGREPGFVLDRGQSDVENPTLLTVQVEVSRRASLESDPYAPVHHDVNLALAGKLLAETACACTATESEGLVRLVITLPFA